jgi:endo-1,4-beta-xylanase
VISSSAPAHAAEPFEQAIWPGIAPGSENSALVEKNDDREIRDGSGVPRDRSISGITKPTITVYLPKEAKRPTAAVLLIPGGGFRRVVIDKEGHDIARWLVKQGIAGIVLKYRNPDADSGLSVSNGAAKDVARAVRMVRHNAKKWNVAVDRIGTMGFSAGGYLAAWSGVGFDAGDAAASDPIEVQSSRPDFIATIYGAVALAIQAKKGSSVLVRADTPPAFLVHAHDDKGVSSERSIEFYLALRDAKVSAELHIYAQGGHGFGTRARGLPVSSWMERWLEWMIAQELHTP